jgi:hypothetical protein
VGVRIAGGEAVLIKTRGQGDDNTKTKKHTARNNVKAEEARFRPVVGYFFQTFQQKERAAMWAVRRQWHVPVRGAAGEAAEHWTLGPTRLCAVGAGRWHLGDGLSRKGTIRAAAINHLLREAETPPHLSSDITDLLR